LKKKVTIILLFKHIAFFPNDHIKIMAVSKKKKKKKKKKKETNIDDPGYII